MENSKRGKIKNFIVDVDGVLTDGKYHYTSEGKMAKHFGPNDGDSLGLLRKYVNIHVVSGDRKGFEISKKRVSDHMKLPIDLVSTFDRLDWIKERYKSEETIYMGDGVFDGVVFDGLAYGIAPANAFYKTKEKADFVTPSKGGENAVAEACFHIMDKFFEPIDLSRVNLDSGEWGKDINK